MLMRDQGDAVHHCYTLSVPKGFRPSGRGSNGKNCLQMQPTGPAGSLVKAGMTQHNLMALSEKKCPKACILLIMIKFYVTAHDNHLGLLFSLNYSSNCLGIWLKNIGLCLQFV